MTWRRGREEGFGTTDSSGAGSPDVRANLAEVRERIARAARKAGRTPESVRLVAVAKGVPVGLVREAVQAGITDLGENRVQEGVAKREALAESPTHLRWHLIGHLQTNKAGRAAANFDLIHSVDSLRVAAALSAAAGRLREGPDPAGARRTTVEVLLQVNLAGEETKFGVDPDAAAGLLRVVAGLPGLGVRGLMTIAPFSADPEESRPVFRKLLALARELAGLRLAGVSLDLLSMGMSQDYEVAVAEGANLVRVGTAIFGPRGG